MQIKLNRLSFHFAIISTFLTIGISIFAVSSFCDDNSKLIVVESGVGRFACDVESKESGGLFPHFEFIKYDFSYFSPEEKIVYYWYKFNRAPFFSQFATIKVILPDGTLLIKDSFNSIQGSTFSPKDTRFSVADIRLKDALKSQKIKPSQYGKCKIELYTEDKRLIDTKYFYLDTPEKLIQLAKDNNENPSVIKRLKDNIERKDKTYFILEKDGEFHYIYKGLSKDRIREELGEPWKSKKLGKNKVVWKYPITNAPYPIVIEGLPINGGNIARVLDDGNEWPIGNTFVLVFENDILKKIQ